MFITNKINEHFWQTCDSTMVSVWELTLKLTNTTEYHLKNVLVLANVYLTIKFTSKWMYTSSDCSQQCIKYEYDLVRVYWTIWFTLKWMNVVYDYIR